MDHSKSGFVYVLSNPSNKGLLKIGLTQSAVYKRAIKLSSGTAVASSFVVEYYAFFYDCFEAEKLVHKKLSHKRTNVNREFFEVDIEQAVMVIESSDLSFQRLFLRKQVDEEIDRLNRRKKMEEEFSRMEQEKREIDARKKKEQEQRDQQQKRLINSELKNDFFKFEVDSKSNSINLLCSRKEAYNILRSIDFHYEKSIEKYYEKDTLKYPISQKEILISYILKLGGE